MVDYFGFDYWHGGTCNGLSWWMGWWVDVGIVGLYRGGVKGVGNFGNFVVGDYRAQPPTPVLKSVAGVLSLVNDQTTATIQTKTTSDCDHLHKKR